MKKYVVGVDGGGTKTTAAIADLKGKILKIIQVGPSSPVNVGVETAAKNIALAIKKVLRPGQVLSTFIGLAAIQEEPRFKKSIKAELFKQQQIKKVFAGKLKIASDQVVAFRAGTDQEDGVLQISGTGCVAHGWKNDQEITASGWHWLADEGSAFWVGQLAFQTALKDLDQRGGKSLITEMAFKKLSAINREMFLKKVYARPLKYIPLLSVVCDEASWKKDPAAIKIMIAAGQELALAAETVIKRLHFQKESFPLVLVGSMFKSQIVLAAFKKRTRKLAPKAKFIFVKKEPVIGAIKLAIEQLTIE